MQRGLTKLGLTEIRIAGFGGQGVILAAVVIGKAAAIFEGAYATMTQSFGPEARGGSSAAQVILSGEPILYPYVTQPDILMVMSQEAYKVFKPQLKPGGILIVEQDLVRIDHPPQGVRFYGVPATRLAEELGRKVVLNIVMVGFFAAVTHMLDPDSLRQAVADSVPPAMQKLNLQAFDKGFEYGAELVHRLAENGDAEQVLALESES
jgi:2-oxoglutarate ferredoxin oxidoreductase subunit gamma